MTLEDTITQVPDDHRWVIRKVSSTELLYQQGTYFANILGPKFGEVPQPDDTLKDHAAYRGHGATPVDALQAAIDSYRRQTSEPDPCGEATTTRE